jgi:hypothetical protein
MKRLLPSFYNKKQKFDSVENDGNYTYEPTTFYGSGSQNKMFEDADRRKHKFFIAEQIMVGNKPSYHYMSFRDVDDFIKFDRKFKSKSFYELIRENTPVNEYYDIDAKVQDWNSTEELITEFLTLRENFFKSNFCPIHKDDLNFVNKFITYDNLYITEACNDKKLSFHFIVKQPCYFKNSNDLKYFMSCFNQFIKAQNTKFQLDLSVYNKNSLMRCTNSCKINDETRVFRKYKFCKRIKDNKKFFCTYNDYYVYGDGTKTPNHISINIVRQKTEDKLDFNTVEQFVKSYEENLTLCTHIINNIEPQRADDYDDWFKVCCALHNTLQGSKEGFDLFIKFSQKSPKFDRGACENLWKSLNNNHTDKPIGLATLVYFYNNDMHPIIKKKLRRRK